MSQAELLEQLLSAEITGTYERSTTGITVEFAAEGVDYSRFDPDGVFALFQERMSQELGGVASDTGVYPGHLAFRPTMQDFSPSDFDAALERVQAQARMELEALRAGEAILATDGEGIPAGNTDQRTQQNQR